MLELYSTLKEQLHSRTDRESLGLWVSSLLDQRVGVLQGELQQEHAQRVQVGTGGYVGECWLPVGFLQQSLYFSSHPLLCRVKSSRKVSNGVRPHGWLRSRFCFILWRQRLRWAQLLHSLLTRSKAVSYDLIRADCHLVVVKGHHVEQYCSCLKEFWLVLFHFTRKQPWRVCLSHLSVFCSALE